MGINPTRNDRKNLLTILLLAFRTVFYVLFKDICVRESIAMEKVPVFQKKTLHGTSSVKLYLSQHEK